MSRAALSRRRGGVLALATVALLAGAWGTGLPTVAAAPFSVPLPGEARSPLAGVSLEVPGSVSLQGPLPAATSMTLTISLALPANAELPSTLVAINTVGSPEYRHFLPLEEFVQTYGPSTAAVAALLAYLASYGLESHGGGPLMYTFVGTAEGVERALDTSLLSYGGPGGTSGFAPSEPPTLPGGLADLVGSIAGLNSFDTPRPTLTTLGYGPTATAITPTVMRGFYNATTLLSDGQDGSAYAIGLSEMCDSLQPSTAVLSSDLASFDTLYSLPAPPSVVYLGDGASSCTQGYPGWSEETDLDMQWAHAMAPGAALYVCLDNSDPDNCDQEFLVNQTVDNIGVVSNSYGWITSDHSVWQAAEAAGLTLFASAGDTCSGVVYPAAEPDGLGVGGTAITPSGDSFGSETAWSCTGSGSSKAGTGGGCDTADAPPSYQTSMTGYPGPCSSSDRGDPDVAMDASGASPVEIYYAGTETSVYGTSLASPMWAATLDDIYGAANDYAGFAGPEIYGLAESQNYSRLYHDITTGNNGYPATVGWDPDTGVGTPNIGALAAAWPKGGGSGTRYAVDFAVTPAGSGGITFASTTYDAGGSAHVPAGNYSLAPAPNAWGQFSAWSTSGSVSVTGGGTTLWVQGAGTLTATYTPLAAISFSVSPATCALTVNGGTSEANGGTGWFPFTSSLSLDANACSGFSFGTWSGGGGVSVASPTSNPTTAAVTGNGTLGATYAGSTTYSVTVAIAPVGDGSLTLGGQAYYDGNVATLPAGSFAYTVAAAPWASPLSVTATGGVSLASGQATVSGTGTITVDLEPLYLPTFSVSPSSCAPLLFNGTSQVGGTGGRAPVVPGGTYPLVAPACSGWEFVRWTTSGGLSADPTSLNETTLTVAGNGSALAAYGTSTLYEVGVTIDPSSCGPFTIDGSPYGNASTADLAAGGYPVSEPSCSGYSATVGFQVTGGVSVNDAGTELTVAGAGDVSLLYSPAPAELTATLGGPLTATAGSSLTFWTSIAGGVSPFGLSWHWGDGSVPLVQSAVGVRNVSEEHPFATAGTYLLKVFVNDSSGQQQIASLILQVAPSGGSTGTGGGGGTSGLSGALLDGLLLAALLGAVALVALLLGRHRRGRGSEPASPGAYATPYAPPEPSPYDPR